MAKKISKSNDRANKGANEGANSGGQALAFEVAPFGRESYSIVLDRTRSYSCSMKWYSYSYSNKAIRVRVPQKLSTNTKNPDFSYHLVFGQSKIATSKAMAQAEYFQVDQTATEIANELQELKRRGTEMMCIDTGGYEDVNNQSQFQEMYAKVMPPRCSSGVRALERVLIKGRLSDSELNGKPNRALSKGIDPFLKTRS